MRKSTHTSAQSPAKRRSAARGALAGIRHVMLSMQRPDPGFRVVRGPRTLEAGLWAAYGFLATGQVVLALRAFFEVLQPALAGAQGPASLAVAALAFVIAMKQSKASRTWQDELLRRLSAYEPTDKAAYRKLQQRVVQDGHARVDAVHEWLNAETQALEAQSGLQPYARDFVSRKV